MSLSIVFLGGVLVFLWLAVRSVRAGHGKLLLWLGLFLMGVTVVLSGSLGDTLAARIFAQSWTWCMIGLPIWWILTAVVRGNRRNG
jgi:hypothetical protein